MLTLYHYDRSTAAQRVRLLIAEKDLPWHSVIVDTARGDISELPADYHQMNPKGLVPVVANNGVGIAESLVIMEYLEDAFPQTSFRPLGAEDRAAMRLWMRRIDDGIHVASRSIGVCLVNRHIYNAKGADKIAAYHAGMRDDVRRDNDQVNIATGLDSPLLPPAIKKFRALFEAMEARLADHDWLAGDAYSLADMALVVYLRRMESFMMAPLWAHMNHLNRWYSVIAARPAWIEAVDNWGDVTAAERVEHGKTAFARVAEMWGEA